MKKEIHSPLHLIKFHCISCEKEYQSYSTSQQNIKVEACSNCHPVYTGQSPAEIKRGQVEKFRQKQEKSKG